MKPVITVQDLFGAWKDVHDTILGKLAILPVEWERPNGNVAHIRSLELEVRTFEALSHGVEHEISLVSEPSLHIFVVRCDDLESYKDHVRSLIRNWYNTVVQLGPRQQWLILHVDNEPVYGSAGSRISGSRLLSLKGSVLDKIRSDFNTSPKIDQCVQIRTGDGKVEMETAYSIIIQKITSGIIASMNAKLDAVENEVIIVEKKMPVDESLFKQIYKVRNDLAGFYQSLSLTADALSQYDKLLSMYQATDPVVLLAIFPSVDTETEQSLAAALPEIVSQLNERVDLFDPPVSQQLYQLYLLSRSSALSHSISAYDQLLTRVLSVARNITSMFPSSIPSTTCAVTFAIIDWSLQTIPNDFYSTAFAIARGDLLNFACSTILKVASSVGLDYEKPETVATASLVERIANPKLKGVCSDWQSLSDYIFNVKEQILADFKFIGRQNSARLLSMELLQHAKRRSQSISLARLREVEETLTHFRTWPELNELHTKLYLACISKDHSPTEYVKAALNILPETKEQDLRISMVEGLDAVVQSLPEDLQFSMLDYATVYIVEKVIIAKRLEGVRLKVCIESSFPKAICVTVTITLKNDLGMIYELVGEKIMLHLGTNTVDVISAITFLGTFEASQICISWGSVRLIQAMPKESIVVCRNRNSPRSMLHKPKVLNSNAPRALALTITNPEGIIASPVLTLVAVSSEILLTKETAEMQPNSSQLVYSLPDVDSAKTREVLFNYSVSQTHSSAIVIKANLRFRTAHGSFEVIEVLTCETGLPLSVHVQDFYRDNQLFSRYEVSCAFAKCLRIHDFELHPSTLSTKRCRKPGLAQVIYNKISATYLTQLDLDEVLIQGNPVLWVTYSSIEEDMLRRITELLKNSSSLASASIETQSLAFAMMHEISSQIEYSESVTRGCIILKDQLKKPWITLLGSVSSHDRELLAALVQQILLMPYDAAHVAEETGMSRIEIQLELPNELVIHTVDIQFPKHDLKIGIQTIVHLTIQSNFRGSSSHNRVHKFIYEFDVDEMSWVIVGKKRAYFTGTSTFETDVCLIPMSTGSLIYPSILVRSVDPAAILSEVHLRTLDSSITVEPAPVEQDFNL